MVFGYRRVSEIIVMYHRNWMKFNESTAKNAIFDLIYSEPRTEKKYNFSLGFGFGKHIECR